MEDLFRLVLAGFLVLLFALVVWGMWAVWLVVTGNPFVASLLAFFGAIFLLGWASEEY